MKIVRTTDELLERPSFRALRLAWPEFMRHDPVSNAHWGRLYSERAEFQFALVDGEEVLAEGNSIPTAGRPPGWRDAFVNGFSGDTPTVLCALQVLVAPAHQGKGLSRLMLEHMRELAGPFGALIAPVRPSWKARYPLTPIERYVEWRREDGSLFDPWLRTHAQLGAELSDIAPEAMRIPGTVAEWEDWAGMAFPETGTYVVPGALVPVDIDRERDSGLYVEPNVWMEHRITSAA